MAQAGGGAEAFKFWQKANGGSGGELGLVPIYGQDEQGNTVVMQPSKEGGLFRANVPEGVTPLSPRELNSERAYGTKSGAATAEQTISAPGASQAADNALGLIKSIREDPSLDWGVGGTSVFNGLPGTSGRGFEAKVAQAKGGAFLTAIQQMQGLGALSNNEGAAATSAVTRMDTALSKEDFLAALADYEKIVSQAKVKAENLMRGGGRSAPRGPVSVGGYSIEQAD
ncbi:MAG: hypothetical protein EOP20_01095 [Hyphomicrobiales bacterium]|nr:MAG: hypothetical protein EOP20_01095 [Hyphomicrobiales bacterium]